MEGIGELMSYTVTAFLWALWVVVMIVGFVLGFNIYKAVVITQDLNRYEQIETDMNTQFNNQDVTTASDQAQLSFYIKTMGLSASNMTSVKSILSNPTGSSGTTGTNRQIITTTVCWNFPVLGYNVGISATPKFNICIPMTGMREAP